MKKLSNNECISVIIALSVVVVFFLFIPSNFSSTRAFLFEGSVDKVELADSSQQDTPTGLIIEDSVEGVGKPVRVGDQVRVHYVGRFTDGVVFDSSTREGIPFMFILGQDSVIQGWERGLVGMKVGGVRMLVVPPELAYGKEGRGVIPPDTTLIFEIELIEILP